MSKAVRIVVADDHPVVRAGLVAVLASDPKLEVVAEASNGAEAIELTLKHKPELLLTDLRMPEFNGDEVAAKVLAELPELKVLVLTTYENDESILSAIEAGASGYLLKAAPSEELFVGIRSVLAGEIAIAPQLAAKLARQAALAATRPKLTKRELGVLKLVAVGKTNSQIAAELYLSEATVKTHLLHVFEKLEVNDRTRAVTLAMELKLI